MPLIMDHLVGLYEKCIIIQQKTKLFIQFEIEHIFVNLKCSLKVYVMQNVWVAVHKFTEKCGKSRINHMAFEQIVAIYWYLYKFYPVQREALSEYIN